MTEKTPDDASPPDPAEYTAAMTELAEAGQRVMREFLSRQAPPNGPIDPLNIANAFTELTRRMMEDPAKLVEAQLSLWQAYNDLWQDNMRRLVGEGTGSEIKPEKGDNRFRDEAWNDNGLFDFIKQSYLLTARWIQNTVNEVDGLDEQTAKKVDFYTRQFVDALAPTNFAMTNPQVLRETIDSKGENLVNGLRNLLGDLERGKGKLRIKMVDDDAFSVGENIATSPGKVVFENELMQLLQFSPATETVARRPLLIIPPWINKYYILDLREKNSFIKWAVEQGLTVFCISWVNPDERLAAKSFEDYMTEGPLAALDAIEAATGEREANLIGYCLGGTLLAATLAYMTAHDDARVASATFFTSMVDFEEPGELGVFIDKEQLEHVEAIMSERGYLDGGEMATTFNMMRANDLIWSFVINNYLLGKDPFPFDLLYWNADSTRMPAAMHGYYLRRMYLENQLVKPAGIELKGTPIDLSVIETPSFILSTREDHIAPWKSTYAATQLYKGPVTFTLAASGHIAGVVNPPEPEKYAHWSNPKKPKDPEAWLAGATEYAGSWWPRWRKWLQKHDGGKVPAREPGDGDLTPIEDAPGRYVQVRTES